MREKYRKISTLMMCIYRRHRQIGESAMAALAIQPSQHFALMKIKRMGRAASQAKLARGMQLSPASVARTLKSLDKDGYITRSGGADGRCNEIAITEKGEKILSQSVRLFQRLDSYSFAGFSSEDLDQLEALLSRMLDNLNEIKKQGEMRK